MKETAEALWLAAALAGIAAWGLWYAIRSLARCRAVANTPVARIRSAAQGYVELTGLGSAPPGTVIRAPLTGKRCLWWRYEIEHSPRSGERRTLDEQTSVTPFLLQDATGQCLVDPQGAEVVAHVREVWRGSTPWPEFHLPAGSGVLGRLVDGLLSSGRYRYIERRLEADRPLYALGEFRTHGGIASGDPEDAAAQLLHEWKQDQATLVARFDRDHDGRIDAAEWEAARAAAREAVLQQRRAHELEPAVATLAAPADGRAYLLSGSDPEALLRRFRWQAAGGMTGFIAGLTALALCVRAMA